MVLAYSHSEWFVPGLQDLIDPQKGSVRRCVWHKAIRTLESDGAQLVKCSYPIAEQDAKKADQLLKDLRNVLDNGTRCLKIFQELSSLLLCRNVHRSSNSESISNFWVAELKTRSPAREASKQDLKPPSLQPSVHRILVSEVLEQLKIAVGQRTKCHGRGKSFDDCENWINKSNGERIVAISRELAEDWSLSSKVLKLLEELSKLVMCRRWHQDQSPSKLEDWTAVIKAKEASRETPQANKTTNSPHTPTRRSSRYSPVETPETQTSSLWTSPRRSRSLESTATTPSSNLSWGRTIIHLPLNGELSRSSNADLRREESCVSPTPISSRTRSMTQGANRSAALVCDSRAFEPFSTVKSSLKAATYVMEKIAEKISPAEFPAGFVYGFRRPGCDLIKIGTTTTTVAQRMRGIGTQCKYTPIVVFQIFTQHAMKVEHLVHRQLYKHNRRECLVNDHCNNGAGCTSRHKEWFEGVSDKDAEAIVRAWVSWIDLEPYDEKGHLKHVWVARTKLFDLTAAGDTWMRWTKITLVSAMREEIKEEAIDAAIKAEEILGAVSRLSSQLVVPISAFSSTAREIREGYSSYVAPVSLPSSVDVFA